LALVDVGRQQQQQVCLSAGRKFSAKRFKTQTIAAAAAVCSRMLRDIVSKAQAPVGE
jgi:hypothetical protein